MKIKVQYSGSGSKITWPLTVNAPAGDSLETPLAEAWRAEHTGVPPMHEDVELELPNYYVPLTLAIAVMQAETGEKSQMGLDPDELHRRELHAKSFTVTCKGCGLPYSTRPGTEDWLRTAVDQIQQAF